MGAAQEPRCVSGRQSASHCHDVSADPNPTVLGQGCKEKKKKKKNLKNVGN